jgi:O-succinylbenzoic acid--CoA ligase
LKPKAKHIIINSQIITPEAIAEWLNKPNLTVWEKELVLFLNEWFSDSDFVVAQTSGSTGEPKPIELPKLVMQKSAERTIEYFGLKSNDRLLLSLPCRYIAGKMMVVRAIVGQMDLITIDPATDFNFLLKETFDLGAMVPNQVFKLLEQPSGTDKLQNIRNLLVGGSAISPDLEAQISKLSSRVVITYGMTETASHVAIRELSGTRKYDFYHCLPGISVSLSPTNCLQIHHPEFPAPLQTNDFAELQSDTAFQVLGRADSVIISGGIKYSPETIEQKLGTLINRRFIISAVTDEKLGERMVLVIEGKSFDTNTLEQRITNILVPYECPKFIGFINRFPETSSGKIIRKEVKKMLQEKN